MRIEIAAQRSLETEESARVTQIAGRIPKFEPRANAAEFTFAPAGGHLQRVSVLVRVIGATPVVVSADGEDYRSALDGVNERLARTLVRRRKRGLVRS